MIPRSFVRILARWLGVSVVVGSLGALQATIGGFSLHGFLLYAFTAAAWVFALGLPFCCLAAAFVESRAGTAAHRSLFAGLLAAVLGFGMWTLIVPFSKRSPVAVFLSLFGGGGGDTDPHDVLDTISALSLGVLPLLMTLVGMLVPQSTLTGGPRSRAVQTSVVVAVAILVAVPIVARNLLVLGLPPVLVAWAPSGIALIAIVVVGAPLLGWREGDGV